jgi:hypothetical protein
MKERIRLRRDSYQQWYANNPVLGTGEPAVESNSNRVKIGDGVSNWRDLPYLFGNLSGLPVSIGDGYVTSLIFTLDERLNIVGSGDTTVSFNDATNTITIDTSLDPNSLNYPIIVGGLGYVPQATGNYASGLHYHSISHISGLQTALSEKQPTGNYTLIGHKHNISDISGLINQLASKQPIGSYSPLVHDHVLKIGDGKHVYINYSTNDTLNIVGGTGTLIGYDENTNTITISSIGGGAGAITNLDSFNIVYTSGYQTISGVKVFNNLVQIGSPLNTNPGILNVYTNDSSDAPAQINLKNNSQINRLSITANDDTQTSMIETSNVRLDLTNHSGEINIFTRDRFTTNIPISGSGSYYQNFSVTDGKVQIGTSFRSGELSVIGSGNFSNSLFVNQIPVSISGHQHTVSDIINFTSGVSGLLPINLVYTTGNQTISGIKTFNNSGIFNDGIISNEGIFENLFTNSIGLIGNNNKIFLTAGSGIFFTYYDEDNILEISADSSVLPVGDTMVLRNIQGDIFARNASFIDIYSNRIISTGGVPFEIRSTNNIILDPSSDSASNNIGNGQNNIIIGSFNDGYGSVLHGEYPPSYDFLCFGSNNILKDSLQSFIIGNNSSSLSSNNSIAIGNNALISNSGQMSYSNGKFQYDGDSQKITYLARGVTIDNNSCILTLDGNAVSNTNIFLLPAETTWAFYGQISAYDYINGYGAAFNIRGGIRRNQSNETKLIGSFIKESWIEPEIENIYVSITANDTDKTLQLEAFGKNGSSIKWTCELNIIQNSNSGTL